MQGYFVHEWPQTRPIRRLAQTQHILHVIQTRRLIFKPNCGAHSTLRMGALVAPKVQIGRHCELGWPQRYGQDVAAKTIFDPRYDAPIYTYN